MVSSGVPQDLLGLSPKPSGEPDWEWAPLAGSMLELEAEERAAGPGTHDQSIRIQVGKYFGFLLPEIMMLHIFLQVKYSEINLFLNNR